MGIYDRYFLPHIIHLACGVSPVAKQRQKVVPLARGRVLEIGLGSGLNLPFYDAGKVEKLWGLDPSEGMNAKAARRVARAPFEVEVIGLPGDEIPLDDDSMDTVLVTYTLCTIPDAVAALRQMRRVLKPGGELIFCEHGAAPDEAVRRWQDRLNPGWGKISGGCNLNRAIPDLIGQGGFAIKGLETMYIPGLKPLSFNYWGTAGAT